MNSKVLTAVGISGLLMAGGVLSASASASGYDLFKTSVKKTQKVNSFTAHVQASLEDNGSTIYSVDSVSKENLKADNGSSNVLVVNDGKKSQMNFYNDEKQTVVKSSSDNKYYVKQDNENKWKDSKDNHKEEQFSAGKQKDIEAIFDALTKNYQDSVTSKELSNGNTELKLDLSKNEIPAVGQAVMSFFLKNIDQQRSENAHEGFGPLQYANLKPAIPQLTSNISVSRVVLKGEVNPHQYLTGQKADVYVSGKDPDGTEHNVVLHIISNLDNLNKTNADTVDLKGKQVVKVQDRHDGHED
ncbi:hypothetical protein [Peribacillus kribbensis]|uniref:hypothetical protein n=1 Tax=Peribacillus kribbensis TaxID=356658 RepID=UPI00041EA48E|nr:hypothetical protein [Peribacillus kribbensis]